LLAAPADLAARGPWTVGVRTVVSDGLVLEVWYPARPGSERGAPPVRYDLRAAMPATEAAKIPDSANAWLPCECARDLPIDDTHGPYPVVVFLHGAASFRAQSTFLMTHWASRGFIVVAPDLPGVGLAATLGGEAQGLPLATPTQVVDLLGQAGSPDPLAFARASIGPGRALVGHSLGSMLANSVVERPAVEVRIAMAGFARPDGAASWLVLAGDRDGIAYSPDAARRFADQPAPSRLAIVHGAGHLAFSDLCTLGADRGGAIAIAKQYGVAVPPILERLASDGCRPADAPFATTAPLIRALTAGVLEERLRCDPRAARAIAALSGPTVTLVENLARGP
jgi:pimeloyl-ACP methyl ester carboxylesterase